MRPIIVRRRVPRFAGFHAAISAIAVAQQKGCRSPQYSALRRLAGFIADFTKRFPACVDQYETLLTDNRIWKQRTVNIGVVSAERALQRGMLRTQAARARSALTTPIFTVRCSKCGYP